MKKLSHVIIIIARIVEIFMWVDCGLSAILTGLAVANRADLFRFFSNVAAGDVEFSLTSGSFSLRVLDGSGNPMPGAYVISFITMVFVFALMAMIARNAHLIFKTAEGRTAFAKGETPFQPDIVRMVREIGIFTIAIPAVEIVMSIVACVALGADMVESSVGVEGIFVGLVVLALSHFFAYGMRLEQDVDGLL